MTRIQGRSGVLTVADLRARSVVDPATHCWIWQYGTSNGRPSIYTIDYGAGIKRVISAPLAVWHIAHEAAPTGLVYRCCGNVSCVNPAHLRLADSHAHLNAIMAASGRLKGLHSPARLDSLRVARSARGLSDTPDEVVLAIRAAPREMSNVKLGALHGISHSTVSRIRLGQSRKDVV